MPARCQLSCRPHGTRLIFAGMNFLAPAEGAGGGRTLGLVAVTAPSAPFRWSIRSSERLAKDKSCAETLRSFNHEVESRLGPERAAADLVDTKKLIQMALARRCRSCDAIVLLPAEFLPSFQSLNPR